MFSGAAAAGYDCVQFSLSCCGLPAMPDNLDAAVLNGIAAAAADSGVGIAALSGTYNMIHPDAAARRQGLTRLSHLLAHARTIGTDLVTLCTGTRDPHDPWRYHPQNEGPCAWATLLAEMEQAAALADRFDVDLGIEPEMANVVASSMQAAQLLRDIRSPHLRIVLDPANIVASPQTDQDWIFAEAMELLGDCIAIVHAKDRDADGSIVAAGEGIIDFPLFFQHLRATGFAGPVITHGLAAEDAPRVATFLRTLAA
ncbi:sugar phosphate isomerase/epimerase [Acidisoma cellulosilytica]|uniref:Sugar phosphate isomerase/epimerase n=1 Tax=Acidisoma cellulosilyticum TaxID=2802395 RepID=A0A963Z453_9PROT|nr:sugar phosphate isomerase/epimerase family protein [Acidisoma cellulosilyticum]MCB8882418.1 sugar phosphate isomerase/epimerase [Acidisoma cellulosilyticum]